MGEFSIWHWIVVLLIVMLLFGSGKISGLMGDLATGIKAFRKTMFDDNRAPGEVSADKPDPMVSTDARTETARASHHRDD